MERKQGSTANTQLEKPGHSSCCEAEIPFDLSSRRLRTSRCTARTKARGGEPWLSCASAQTPASPKALPSCRARRVRTSRAAPSSLFRRTRSCEKHCVHFDRCPRHDARSARMPDPTFVCTVSPRHASRGHDQQAVVPFVPLARSVVVGAAAFARAFGSGRFSFLGFVDFHSTECSFFVRLRNGNRCHDDLTSLDVSQVRSTGKVCQA